MLSVVIPVYKVPRDMLKKCVDSVLGQTYRDLDILLVDDGSPDDCGAICDQYAREDARVRVIHQANQGLSVVRNVGVSRARGEWISFIDGDDWIEPDTYAKVAQWIEAEGEDADLLAWDGYAETPDGARPLCLLGEETEAAVFTTREAMVETVLPARHRASFRYALFEVTWAKAYRRSLLTRHRIENVPGLQRAQDLIFNLHVFEHARKMLYRKMHLYHYNLHEAAVTRKYDPRIAEKMLAFSVELEKYVHALHNSDDYHQRMYTKIMPKVVECFTQNYVNPHNRQPLKARRRAIRGELDAPILRETFAKLRYRGNMTRIKVYKFLLKNRLYLLAMGASYGYFAAKKLYLAHKR